MKSRNGWYDSCESIVQLYIGIIYLDGIMEVFLYATPDLEINAGLHNTAECQCLPDMPPKQRQICS